MSEERRKPAIRFAGFTEEWERRKVGELCEIVAGGTPSTSNNQFWNPKEIPWLSSGEVHKKRISTTDDLISQNGFNNSSAKWVKENSVLIALAGQGKTRGTVAINSISLTTNQSIAAMIPSKELSFEFLFENLESRYDEIRMLSSADGSRGGLNKQMVADIFVTFPGILEQETIGTFLSHLDTLITLHQRKYDKLVCIKKAMLEKMFPKNGSCFPEIRFAGFTDAWERRQWSDTVEISTEMVDPRTGIYDGLPHVAPGNIESFTGHLYDNVKLVKDENLISGKFHFYDGDILYGKINPQLGKYVFARFEGLTSADAYVLNAKNGLAQEYLYSILQTRDFFNYSVSVSMRSGMQKYLPARCFRPDRRNGKHILQLIAKAVCAA